MPPFLLMESSLAFYRQTAAISELLVTRWLNRPRVKWRSYGSKPRVAPFGMPSSHFVWPQPETQKAFSGRYCRSCNPIKLPGKRSQTEANHTEVDQPTQIRDVPNDGDNQQTQQQSQHPIAPGRPSWLQ